MKINVKLLTIHLAVFLCMIASFAKAQPTPPPLTYVQQCTDFCNASATFNTSEPPSKIASLFQNFTPQLQAEFLIDYKSMASQAAIFCG